MNGRFWHHWSERGAAKTGAVRQLERIRLNDQLISVATMQRYIHPPDIAPMEYELRIY